MHVLIGAMEGAGIGLGTYLLVWLAQRRGWVRKPNEMVSLFGKLQK